MRQNEQEPGQTIQFQKFFSAESSHAFGSRIEGSRSRTRYSGWWNRGHPTVTGSEALGHVTETDFKPGPSKEDIEAAISKLTELEIFYMNSEEEFINNRIVLIILTAISAVLGMFCYFYRNSGEFVPLLVPIIMALGCGFYVVTTGIIGARSKMRKARRIQELLRAALHRAS